ncbi:MAG: thioredoxin domain-containing protein, partial [Acidobacteriota bacterium]
MRSILLVIPSLLLAGTAFAQSSTPPAAHKKTTPEHRAAPLATPAKNFKLSGSPSAPITVELYTDYECPSCRMFFKDVLPQLEAQYVATGKIQLMHRDFRLPQHQYSKLAARYANAAGQIGQYQIVAAQLFEKQQDWAANWNVDGVVAKVL